MTGDDDAKTVYIVAEQSDDHAKQFYNRAEYFGVDTMSGDNDTESFYVDAEYSGDYTEWFDDRTKQYGDYTK
ncbi:MAG: hypothetical protein NTX44_03690 [Ignavibacteriales bacterium]|nr:hypothetical protein [Ignavibacteriales bacterium]